MSDWKKTSEQLPPSFEPVLVISRKGNVAVAELSDQRDKHDSQLWQTADPYYGVYEALWFQKDFPYWMPLPDFARELKQIERDSEDSEI